MKKVLVCFFIGNVFLTLALRSDESVGLVRNPQDLQDQLHWVQLMAPPADINSLEHDSGRYLFQPDLENDNEAIIFSQGFIYKLDESGDTVVSVSVFEEPSSRDTVFLNADEEEIYRIPPLFQYSPFWVLDAYYPDVFPPDYLLDQYDPARVIMKATLLPVQTVSEYSLSGNSINSSGISLDDGLNKDVDNEKSDSNKNNEGNGKSILFNAASDLEDVAAGTNKLSVVKRRRRSKSRNIYVSRKSGNDEWNGKSIIRGIENGPKYSIEAGLKALKENGRLFVANGRYSDKIDIRGKNVRVKINGDVILAESVVNKPDNAVRTDWQDSITKTNQVGAVLISKVISEE